VLSNIRSNDSAYDRFISDATHPVVRIDQHPD
jgi:hypothetical protein